jgi:hypothetical protein
MQGPEGSGYAAEALRESVRSSSKRVAGLPRDTMKRKGGCVEWFAVGGKREDVGLGVVKFWSLED